MRSCVCFSVVAVVLLAGVSNANAQTADESPWVFDLGFGIDPSINGNVNSGAIGRLQGQATAILPNSYGDVYGTGIQFRFGGGYRLSPSPSCEEYSAYQSADADLVRLGDLGPSSLYAQYSDYKSIGLDFGYRRYLSLPGKNFRVYGEGTIGLAFVNSIDAQFAAPQSNAVLTTTDFYDDSGAFTWGINLGILFPIAKNVDLNGQLGLRHVGGLSEVDQLVGTGLEDLNSDSARLTFPIVVGVRFRFD